MADNGDARAQELAEAVRAIQERVRARYPQGHAGSVVLPDLMPLVHARDAAEAKVAAIGKVNPRPPGLVNNIVQWTKRTVARALDWHVREQIEFNRASMDCVEALMMALNETNRALAALSSGVAAAESKVAAAESDAHELRDVRVHWSEWRQAWERKLVDNEVRLLRSVADLQALFQYRLDSVTSSHRELAAAQHHDFESSLARSSIEIQLRIEEDLTRLQRAMWADLERIRSEYERLIHSEIRVVRQRAQALLGVIPQQASAQSQPASMPGELDYARFADRFRGSEEYVKDSQRDYEKHFQGCKLVLDIGCGRGEFLELARAWDVPAHGIDTSEECVALCRSKGLDAEIADLFPYLAQMQSGALDGIFCAQVIEHLPPDRLPEMLRLCAEVLPKGGLILLETPNPECLAIFATHFYLDPTHTRPVPPALLTFLLEEAGFGRIEIVRRAPAVESMPSLGALPEEFRDAFFDGLDYAAIARRL